MYIDTRPTGTGLSIICDGVRWPDDDEIRQEIAQRVENKVCAALESVGIPASKTTLYNQYVFAQVTFGCPVCQGTLRVGTFEDDSAEWAYAPVECRQCEWSSRAVYSLVDFHDNISWPELAAGVTPEAVKKYDDLNPTYDPYPPLADQTGQLR